MKKEQMYDDDVSRVLRKDGVKRIELHEFENLPTINLEEIKKRMGNDSWATRVIYNDRFGGVLIKQHPGEGNRLHYHPSADECWVILEGDWEWYIEGEGKKHVTIHDIIVVKKGVRHKITCVGDSPGIRLAVTMPDVDHVYAEENS